MTDQNELVVRQILAEYGLKPNYIEKQGKVYKIYTQEYIYALKETDQPRPDFYRLMQWMDRKGFYRYVPIYPTRKGESLVYMNQKYYYLMPWITHHHERSHHPFDRLFQELGRLHALTAKMMPITEEELKTHHQRTQETWQREADFVERYIEQCEQKWYMSPFEWEFIQYYDDIQKAYMYAKNCLDRWKDSVEERMKIRTVMIHGKLDPTHIVYDYRGFGYFINFEKSRMSSPTTDLLPLFSNSFKTYPSDGPQLEWLKAYARTLKFTKDERFLFKGYLAHPGKIIRILQQYETNRLPNHELSHTNRIQKFYWFLKNTERFIMKMEEWEDKMDEEDVTTEDLFD